MKKILLVLIAVSFVIGVKAEIKYRLDSIVYPESKFIFIYNEDDQVVEEASADFVDQNWNPRNYTIFAYDLNGNRISKVSLNANRDSSAKTMYSYDTLDREIDKVDYKFEGLSWSPEGKETTTSFDVKFPSKFKEKISFRWDYFTSAWINQTKYNFI